MYPTIYQLGPVTIYSLWVLVAVGFLISLLILHKLIQKDRSKLHFIAEHSLAIFLGGLVMARLFFVMENFKYFILELNTDHFIQIFYIWDKNLSFWGGMTGIVISLIYFCRKEKENIQHWLDILTVSTLGGMVFGHIGALLDGRNYGNETTLPWGIIIENSRFAVPIHPTQIYAAIYTGILTLIFFKLYNSKNNKKDGTITILAILSYSFLKFLEEFMRGDESNYFFGLRQAQIFCLIALISTSVLLYLRLKNKSAEKVISTSSHNL